MRYIYLLRNLVNGKVYVGQTKFPGKRKIAHFCHARKGTIRPLYASIRKYGEDNFQFEVLEECSDELANEREVHWVAHFDSCNHVKGYNLTSGGRQHFEFSEATRAKLRAKSIGYKHSDETRKKMSEARARRRFTDEDRAKLSAHLKGKPSFFKGRKHSEKSIQKIREARRKRSAATQTEHDNT